MSLLEQYFHYIMRITDSLNGTTGKEPESDKNITNNIGYHALGRNIKANKCIELYTYKSFSFSTHTLFPLPGYFVKVRD